MLVKVIFDWSESFQIQYHCRIWRMNKYRAIPSWEIARSLLIIYGRFDRNSLCWRTARRIGKPLTAVFHFWFASSNWSADISMVQVYSYLKELHQEDAWWPINWVANSLHLYNPAKVVSVDFILKKITDHSSTNILTQKSRQKENYRSEGIR